MTDSLSKYIFSKDFIRSRHQIIFKNETSQTFFLDTNKLFIKELFDNGITAILPKGHCQTGHSLNLYFYPSEKILLTKLINLQHTLNESNFQVIAKVENLTHLEDDSCSITLTFTQFNFNQWKAIIEFYQKKQNEINDLIKSQISIGDDNE